jgi:hypothetical protein
VAISRRSYQRPGHCPENDRYAVEIPHIRRQHSAIHHNLGLIFCLSGPFLHKGCSESTEDGRVVFLILPHVINIRRESLLGYTCRSPTYMELSAIALAEQAVKTIPEALWTVIGHRDPQCLRK